MLQFFHKPSLRVLQTSLCQFHSSIYFFFHPPCIPLRFLFFQAVFTPGRINHMWATGQQTKEGISRSFSVSRSADLSPSWLMECKIHSSSLMSLSLRYDLCWCSGEKKRKKKGAHVSVPWCAMDQPWNSLLLTHTLNISLWETLRPLNSY